MNPPGKIIVTTAHLEFPLCPAVYVGRTNDGATVYARYRWGRLSVRLDHRDPPILGGAAGRWIIDEQLDPNGLDGSLEYDTLREITADIITWPDDLTPKTYDESESWLDL